MGKKKIKSKKKNPKKKEIIKPEVSELEEIAEQTSEDLRILPSSNLPPTTTLPILEEIKGSQEISQNIEDQISSEPTPTNTEQKQPDYLPPQESSETEYESTPKEQFTSGGTISIQPQFTQIEKLRTNPQQEFERTIGSPGTSSAWSDMPRNQEKYFARTENTAVEDLGKNPIQERKEIKYRPKAHR